MATTSRIKSATENDREELEAQIETLQRDIKEMSKTITKLANSQIEAVKDEAIDKSKQAEEMVRANPLTAIAISLGLGFLFGAMTRR